MELFAKIIKLRERSWVGYGIAMAGSLLALGIRLALGNAFLGAPFITFLPVIVLSALLGGALPGLLATFLAGLLASYFIIKPVNLSVMWPTDWVLVLAFVMITSLIIGLIELAMFTALRLARATRLLQIENDTLEERIAGRTAALVEAEAQFRQAQKMEAIGQLTGGIAHDFNNLLAAIAGSLDLLESALAQGNTDDLKRFVTAAQEGTQRATAVTNRLLTFARRRTLDSKPTDINNLVAGMQELIRRTVGPMIKVEVIAAPGIWPVMVDAHELEQALLNLCINANSAMPEGGRLTIETENRRINSPVARVGDLPLGEYVSLCVSDNGTGMPADVISRAFEPFFTTKGPGQGIGLGLAMVHSFVRQSGGDVRIYSEQGHGTMLCIYLPRYQGAMPTADPAGQPPAQNITGNGESILVVDDEPPLRMLIVAALQKLGYNALEASDGHAGLQILKTDLRVDLLVTDIGMPDGMNGLQLAEAGLAIRPDLKILFITGYAETTMVTHHHLQPRYEVLTKPFSMKALSERINALLGPPATDGQTGTEA